MVVTLKINKEFIVVTEWSTATQQIKIWHGHTIKGNIFKFVTKLLCAMRMLWDNFLKHAVITLLIGVARGCSGCTCTPMAVKKNLGEI